MLTTASRGQAPLTTEERELLDRLGDWVEERRSRPDARFQQQAMAAPNGAKAHTPLMVPDQKHP